MWFAIVDADAIGIEIKPENGKRLTKVGEMIKVAAREQFPVNHPVIHYPGNSSLFFTKPNHPQTLKNNWQH